MRVGSVRLLPCTLRRCDMFLQELVLLPIPVKDDGLAGGGSREQLGTQNARIREYVGITTEAARPAVASTCTRMASLFDALQQRKDTERAGRLSCARTEPPFAGIHRFSDI